MAAAVLALAAPARAGDAEVGALNAKLIAQGVLLSSANSTQLANAVLAVLNDPAFNKLKSGIIIGEALKAAGVNAPDAGDVIGTAVVNAAAGSTTLSTRLGLATAFTGQAALTAGTGRAPNVTQVEGFSRQVLSTDAEAITAAVAARTSKTALAAIFAGRSSEVADDTARVALFQQALANKLLLTTVQNIATGIGGSASDSAVFANTIAQANVKYASPIVIGVSVSDPTNTGTIVRTALENASLPALKTGVAVLAKSTAAVADIEEIEKIGSAVGSQIRLGTVKLVNAAAITKTLVQAIIAKPTSTGLFSDRNRADNKRDEIAEVAAYMLGSVIGSAQLNSTTTAKTTALVTATVLNIIKAAVAGAKSTKVGTPALAEVAADVVASVAYTVKTTSDALFTPELKAAILSTLTLSKNAAAVAGVTNTAVVVAAAQNAFDDAQLAANANRLENGNQFNTVGQISDPETDIRGL